MFLVSSKDSIFIQYDTKFTLHYPLVLVFTFELKPRLWYHFSPIYINNECMILKGSLLDPMILVFAEKLNE